ncbi:metalloregulator ArsR/SmtB family transcription factor [Brevibacillus fortis]|uniref:Transcriptional regulator n=1 Tax=Brevibacillus fortis TaxID=2126352 RepID=A0A2P7V8G6_9BACL|nr:metalloregulator ArsR/SmtB family transcription factor [Brevibacillus fortis]MED1783817.1 metalloregulator ArsR/SmtB family transcription factor [Brevibacillus fortis]PSJ95495.1 transcriptional regulator [Brevibacillus fortis]
MKTMSIFEILAEPHRRTMLDLLRIRERSVGELVDKCQLSQPGVSKHLRIMREAGLVTVRSVSQKSIYSIRPEPLQEIDKWLESYRHFWSSKLDELEAFLDHEKE